MSLQNEAMTGVLTQNPVFSRVTLALMEDTGQVLLSLISLILIFYAYTIFAVTEKNYNSTHYLLLAESQVVAGKRSRVRLLCMSENHE